MKKKEAKEHGWYEDLEIKAEPELAAPDPEPSVMCDICEELFMEGNLETLDMDGDTKQVCANCKSNLLICEDCDEYMQDGDSYKVKTNKKSCKYVCESCSQEYSTCNCCGDKVIDDSFIMDGDHDIYLCVWCYEADYFTCDGCEHIFHSSDYGENGMCCDCAENEENDEEAPIFVPPKGDKKPVVSFPNKLVSFDVAVKSFYMLCALDEIAARRRDDLHYTINRELKQFSKQFAIALFDYMVIACMGEARHAQWNSNSPYMIKDFFPTEGKPNREYVYHNMASKIDPIASAPALIDVYSERWRNDGYGGLKWLSIVKAFASYPDRISDVTFVDMVVNKRHNGSLAFDKNVRFSVPNASSIINYLDFRREFDLFEYEHLVRFKTEYGGISLGPITIDVNNLIMMARRARLIPSSFPATYEFMTRDLKWLEPIKWVLKSAKVEGYVAPFRCSECNKTAGNCGCDGGPHGLPEPEPEEGVATSNVDIAEMVNKICNNEGYKLNKPSDHCDEEYHEDPSEEGSPLTEKEKEAYAFKYHEYRQAVAGLGILEVRNV